jgi:hypothetical protein
VAVLAGCDRHEPPGTSGVLREEGTGRDELHSSVIGLHGRSEEDAGSLRKTPGRSHLSALWGTEAGPENALHELTTP